MEKRRNRPEKYNRELVHKTVKAMERISEVRVTLVCCNNVYPVCKSRQMGGLQSEGFKGCALLTSGVLAQVRQKRQDRFHEARMRKAKQQQVWAHQYLPSSQLMPDTLSKSGPAVVNKSF